MNIPIVLFRFGIVESLKSVRDVFGLGKHVNRWISNYILADTSHVKHKASACEIANVKCLEKKCEKSVWVKWTVFFSVGICFDAIFLGFRRFPRISERFWLSRYGPPMEMWEIFNFTTNTNRYLSLPSISFNLWFKTIFGNEETARLEGRRRVKKEGRTNASKKHRDEKDSETKKTEMHCESSARIMKSLPNNRLFMSSIFTAIKSDYRSVMQRRFECEWARVKSVCIVSLRLVQSVSRHKSGMAFACFNWFTAEEQLFGLPFLCRCESIEK